MAKPSYWNNDTETTDLYSTQNDKKTNSILSSIFKCLALGAGAAALVVSAHNLSQERDALISPADQQSYNSFLQNLE
jgi:hypothetical protein